MFDLAVPVAPTDHSIGPSHAQLTLVEYGDFECPNCKQAAPVVKLLLSHFSDRLRFVYRHFPLEEVHPQALSAALAAECAGGQGRFWAMHDLLFEHQPALHADQLQAYAQRLELDMTRFSAEMSRHGLPAANPRATGGWRKERSARDADFLYQRQAARRFIRDRTAL